jgi:hypothetical protein
MPRTKDVPCARCGELMWRGTGSLPAGKATCWPCRRVVTPRPTPKPPAAERTIACVKCGLVFTTRKANQKYCTARCRPPSHYTKVSTTARGYGSAHQRKRKELLPKAYGHRCPICYQVMLPSQALDLDHSVPLAFGGQAGDRITHASCNRKRGNQTKRQMRTNKTTRTPPPTTSRVW